MQLTFATSKGTPDLPPLNAAQQHRLALLTLLSLASEPDPLTYEHLISALFLSSTSDLESLITEAIYNGLITARLSPTSTPPMVYITSVAPLRDLRPNSLPDIVKVLQVWENRCSSVVGEIEAQIAGIRSNAAKRMARDTWRQEIVDHAVLYTEISGENTGTGGGGAGVGRTTRSGVGTRGGLGDDSRKGKGIGNKRDLDEQQEDEEVAHWGHQTGGEEDGGVGVGLARMEVDEGAGLAGRGGDGGRTAKRAVGKKGL